MACSTIITRSAVTFQIFANTTKASVLKARFSCVAFSGDKMAQFWKLLAIAVLISFVCIQGNDGTVCINGNTQQPININIYNKEDKQKPSAHIEGPTAKLFTYNPSGDIATWTSTAPNAHVTGGMTYSNGRLTIPSTGFYYVYAQAYFHDGSNKYKRIFVYRNGNPILLTQPARFNSVTGTGYTGGVFRLQAGDVISVRVMAQNTGIHMDPAHTFFGAFMI